MPTHRFVPGFGPGFGPGFRHGPGVFAWVLLALFVVAVVLGIVALVRLWRRPRLPLTAYRHPHWRGPWEDPALAELRMRYARGEIDHAEYAARAGQLGHPVGAEHHGVPQPTSTAPPPPGQG